MSYKKLVVITGSDSGLGWTLAARCAREGLLTVAGMHRGTETKAARALKHLCAYTCSLDVTSTGSIAHLASYVKSILEQNQDHRLHAIVNNAGVMTVGEFEWQPPSMVENMIKVNLLGPMAVTSAFLPELRKSATDVKSKQMPRVINVASHCGLHPLPYFSAYSASKAGLLAWTEALRLELRPYGVTACAFIPGGFVGFSNILSEQATQGKIMIEHLNAEQKSVYESKIKALTEYLQTVSRPVAHDSLNDENITETFMRALIEPEPREIYKVESYRYKLFYNLLGVPLPEAFHSWLVKRFLAFPF